MTTETSSLELEIASPLVMHELGIRLGRFLAKGDLVVLNGELGAGKTTLTRGIGEGLGVRGTIASPTFLIARTHETESGIRFNHIDAYRLSSPQELDDLDIDFANSISVIEWGKGFTDGIASSWLSIDIDRSRADDVRLVKLSGFGSKFLDLEKVLGDAL